jgi:hypothetical protein
VREPCRIVTVSIPTRYAKHPLPDQIANRVLDLAQLTLVRNAVVSQFISPSICSINL